MKKTLIALAAVAVAGAASAQVTLSGKYAFGYVSDKVSGQSASTGLKSTDGHFTLTAVEDLGGGLKAIAKAEVLSRGRGDAITGRDASLTLAGGFGTVSMGSVESGNPVNAYFGSDGRGLDGNTWTKLAGETHTAVTLEAANVDFIKYTTPQVAPGLTFSVSKADQPGTGTVNQNNTVRVSANYAQGPITVDVDNTSYKEGSGLIIGADGKPTGDNVNLKSRLVIGGSYDLGVAKLSAGFQTYKLRDAGSEKLKENVLGVSMPVASNVSVGLTYATAKAGSGADALDVKGYDLGATYSLSKRTNVNFSYASVNTGRKDAAGANITNKMTRAKLTHSF